MPYNEKSDMHVTDGLQVVRMTWDARMLAPRLGRPQNFL